MSSHQKDTNKKIKTIQKSSVCTFDLRYQIEYHNTENGIAKVENFICMKNVRRELNFSFYLQEDNFYI